MTFDLLINVLARHINIPQLIISSIRRAGISQSQQQNISHTHIQSTKELVNFIQFLSIVIQNNDILIEIYLNIDLVTINSSKISIIQPETDE
jgi:hypothetical protein